MPTTAGVAIYSHDRRDGTLTPPCGKLRPQPESSKNPLLVNPTLGTVRAATWDLPSAKDFHHEYGLRQHRDGLTSGDVVGGWASHQGTGDLQTGRDFKALNAMAAVEGATTAKDFAEYRASHDARLKVGQSTAAKVKKQWDDTTRFGRNTQSSTPMDDLMSHSYRFDWIAVQPSAAEALQAGKSKKPGQTKTSRLQAETNALKLEALNKPDEVPKYWKMSSFDKVPAKVGYEG